MRALKVLVNLIISIQLLAVGDGRALADEGMWTFDNLPLEQLKTKYGFIPDKAWLEKVRLATVRFNDGGTGSLVSPQGLVITNHHVAVGQLQKMSSAKKDYVKYGFYAKTLSEEIKCVDLEINVLVSTEQVTDRVLAAIKKGMTPEQALKARQAEQAKIEKESKAQTGLRSEVVMLYNGGEYWLYRYRQYKDIRLVMAPEKQAAFFGGDSDNFTYPRHDLDMAFFRVYENGKPLSTKNYFKMAPKAGAQDELVFVSGHPGNTDRSLTVAQLKLQNEVNLPAALLFFERNLAALKEYSKLGTEQKRRAATMIFGLSNGQKALSHLYSGLQNPNLMTLKKNTELELKKKVDSNPRWKKAYAASWNRIETVLQKNRKALKEQQYQRIFRSKVAQIAINIVKYVQEIKKPDADRLDGFHDSELEELKFYLFSQAPLYTDLEAVLLETSFRISLEKLPQGNPYIKILNELGDPVTAANKLVNGTQLMDVAQRKKLIEGGEEAVNQSQDSLIVFARNIVPILRKNEQWMKKNVLSIIRPASEKIAQARFEIFGKALYPDATFTLRLTFGQIKGYPMNGTQAPYKTTLYGLYDRALSFNNRDDWYLPRRFWQRQKQLDLSTPVNFVSTCDIIGGNSGSPILTRQAELIGVIFDGNIESLVGNYIYDDTQNRAVSLHVAYVIEALNKLYDASPLAAELLNHQ